jgi:hypothetical protein
LIFFKFEFVTFECILASVGAVTLFDYMVVDFVGKAVYGGDPEQPTDSVEAQLYQDGTRMTALAFLLYNIVFLLYSLIQNRILKRLGKHTNSHSIPVRNFPLMQMILNFYNSVVENII